MLTNLISFLSEHSEIGLSPMPVIKEDIESEMKEQNKVSFIDIAIKNEMQIKKKGIRFSEEPLESANSAPLIQEIPAVEVPQSILKSTGHVPRVDWQAVEAMDRRNQTVILPESVEAFKGPIVERDPLAILPTQSSSSSTNKRESKFKSNRKK